MIRPRGLGFTPPRRFDDSETQVCAYLSRLSLVDHFAAELDPASVRGGADPSSISKQAASVSMDIVMMDPPFDMEYIYTTYLLER